MAQEFINYYSILEVERGAHVEEIKKAFRQKIKTTHPDKNQEQKQIDNDQEKCKQIIQAWNVLQDAQLRKQFDLELDIIEKKQKGRECYLQKVEIEGKVQENQQEGNNNGEVNNDYEQEIEYECEQCGELNEFSLSKSSNLGKYEKLNMQAKL